MLKRMLIMIGILTIILQAADDEFKWGKVPEEILAAQSFWVDSSQAAVVIFDIGTLTLNNVTFDAKSERHVRLKIYKDSGKEYAKIRIPYWYEDAFFDLRAQTILPDGKKISLKRKDIHYEGEKDGLREAVFTIPGVENNCVIEYSYKLTTEHLALLDPWEFQSDIYTQLSRFTLCLPAGFNYRSFLKNGPRGYQPSSEKVMSTNTLLMSYTWELKDIEPLKQEPFMTALEDYRCMLNFQLVNYQDAYNNIKYVSTWEDIKKQVEPTWKPFLDETRYLTDLSSKITDTLISNTDKVECLYNYVRDSLESTADVGFLGDIKRPPKKIVEQRSGSPAEKNLLLVALLRNAGLTANPLLISTRGHGRLDTTNPLIKSFNRLIVQTRIGSIDRFMDAAEPYCPEDILPYWDNNGSGLLITDNEAKIVDLAPPKNMSMGFSSSVVEIDSVGDARVGSVIRMEGYQGIDRKKRIAQSKDVKKYVQENLLDALKNVEIDTFLIEENPKDGPLMMTVNFKVKNFADMAGDKMFFSASLLQRQNENIFKSEKRNFSIDYAYPFINQEEIEFKIPEGYLVEEKPPFQKYNIVGQDFFRTVTETDTTLKVMRNHTCKKNTYDSWNYDALKTFYGRMVASDNEQVVFGKKAQ